LRFRSWSYRFAEQIFNSKFSTKKEIESIIESITLTPEGLSRPRLNDTFRKEFLKREWEEQPRMFDKVKEAFARIDFLKDRIGVEVAFSHESFIGIDLLKFQTLSYSYLNKIDLGVYVAVTRDFRRVLIKKYKQKWTGSSTFEKVCKYLPHFRSAIQVPIFVIGLEE